MKKMIIFFIIFLNIISHTFAYNFSKKDEKLLNKIYKVIDKKFYKKQKAKKLYLKIKKVKPKFFVNKTNKKYRKKIRIYYTLDALEKYLEKKINISHKNNISQENNFKNKKSFINSWNNLVNPEKIEKISNKQDNQEIIINSKKNISKKINKNGLKIKKSILKKIVKKSTNKNIFKTTKNNWVFIKYVKIDKNKYIPKHTPKNLIPEIQTKFLVKKITDKNQIIIKYFKEYKFIKITGLSDYSCNSQKLNIYLKNNLENKVIELNNLKKKNKKTLKWEFLLNWKEISKILIEINICEIKK